MYSEESAVFAAALKSPASHSVIKSHRLDLSVRQLCTESAVKTIHTWRDPYDAVASCRRMFGSSAVEAIRIVKNALQILSFHKENNSACVVSYTAIMVAPLESIFQIACYLGVEMQPEILQRIAGEVSFEQVRQFSRHVSELQPSRLARSHGLVFDRETLLHQDHIRDGSTGYGITDLDPDVLAQIDSMLIEEGFECFCRPLNTVQPDPLLESVTP